MQASMSSPFEHWVKWLSSLLTVNLSPHWLGHIIFHFEIVFRGWSRTQLSGIFLWWGHLDFSLQGLHSMHLASFFTATWMHRLSSNFGTLFADRLSKWRCRKKLFRYCMHLSPMISNDRTCGCTYYLVIKPGRKYALMVSQLQSVRVVKPGPG